MSVQHPSGWTLFVISQRKFTFDPTQLEYNTKACVKTVSVYLVNDLNPSTLYETRRPYRVLFNTYNYIC